MFGKSGKLQKELLPQVLRSRKVKAEFAKVSTALFLKEKQRMLSIFDAHPITRELLNGENSSNLSGTLPHGNLFGFIGFVSGTDVISGLRSELEKINIKPKFDREKIGEKVFLVNIPSSDDLYAMTPLPWASGRSWLHGIENGMSGLGKYMYTLNAPTSRSGAGIQTGSVTSTGGSLAGVRYLTNGILNDFEESLTKISSGQKGFGIVTT